MSVCAVRITRAIFHRWLLFFLFSNYIRCERFSKAFSVKSYRIPPVIVLIYNRIRVQFSFAKSSRVSLSLSLVHRLRTKIIRHSGCGTYVMTTFPASPPKTIRAIKPGIRRDRRTRPKESTLRTTLSSFIRSFALVFLIIITSRISSPISRLKILPGKMNTTSRG